MNKRLGFTLIELLIVVAIIAILAAIAVPNFLEAQTRAKVSRVKADLRTLATGMESYYVDNNKYPVNSIAAAPSGRFGLILLSSPIAYVTTGLFLDPFIPPGATNMTSGTGTVFAMTPADRAYQYSLRGTTTTGVDVGVGGGVGQAGQWWLLRSIGPDKDADGYSTPIANNVVVDVVNKIYDPTNGTISDGNVYRTGGAAQREAGQTLIQMTSR